ncbi:MAG: M48 family metallopeptidase [Bryobacteraceae bacterium]
MRTGRRQWMAVLVILLSAMPLAAQPSQFRPGFNLFTRDQDIQLGKEAAAEIEKQVEIVDNPELNAYIRTIGSRLTAQPQADKYPYFFKVVNDPSINAFALPGGPIYVHTGLIAAAENESQLAGVLAHEIVHVALRHGTNQASRANLIQLPLVLTSRAAGNTSLLGQLTQIGLGLGANSVLLKFSRTAETQADLMGVQIAAQAGYNPAEMARFFEKLEAEGGARAPQFLSSHPNPGNRKQAIENEIRQLPPRRYDADTGQLPRMKSIVSRLPAPNKTPAQGTSAAPAPLSSPSSGPSGRLQPDQGRVYSLSYPDNWKAFPNEKSGGVILASPSGVQQTQQGVSVGYGAILDYYQPKDLNATLWQATDEFIQQLRARDPRLRAGRDMPREIRLGNKRAIVSTLNADSLFQGQTEVDQLVTIPHPKGILYIVFASPEGEAAVATRTFDQMLQSLRLSF